MDDVTLRSVEDSDLDIFFAQQREPEAIWMAAFTSKDPSDHAAFLAHWARIRADPTTFNQTILADGAVAGYVSCYQDELDRTEVCYWLGKEFWGQGVATRALSNFLSDHLTARPVYARVAQDNPGSRRVLEKSGFRVIGEDAGYANARQAETAEYLLRLDR
jgi:RimJ/RimL family protein N-acetyltransferase